MKVVKKITDGLIMAICLVSVLLASIQLFGYSLITIETASMMPEIPVGSACIIDGKADMDYIPKNAVITFKVGTDKGGKDVYVTHRVISAKDDGSYITKGDANENRDYNPVPKENIIGIVKYHMPVVGYFVKWISQAYAKAIFITFISFLIILSFLLDFFLKGKSDIYISPEMIATNKN